MRRGTKLLLDRFIIEGKKGSEALTDGQIDIFETLIYRENDRVQIETCTRYGKSLVVALAAIIISCVQDIIVAVVAPTKEKAKQIMRYYIDHLGDSVLFESQLDKNTKLDRLRQEESKDRIILRDGGGIFVLSTNERNFKKSIESVMGAGGKVTILDEGCLIRDDTEATVYRMIGGIKGAFYCKVGNPFYRDPPYSHFWKSHKKYNLIRIDYKQALKEGRYSKEFIKEAREKPLFDVLYGCRFPKKREIDDRGYRYLLTDEAIKRCKINSLPENIEGEKILGSDIGEGNNANVHTIRQGGFMWKVNKNFSKDLMAQVGIIRNIDFNSNFIDKIGVGAGVLSRCLELGLNCKGINWGQPAEDSKQFANLKAENYWRLKKWIEDGGKILWDDDWEDLGEIKYKINSSGKVQMESKEEMDARGIKSPDTIDSAALTFNKTIEEQAPNIRII